MSNSQTNKDHTCNKSNCDNPYCLYKINKVTVTRYIINRKHVKEVTPSYYEKR